MAILGRAWVCAYSIVGDTSPTGGREFTFMEQIHILGHILLKILYNVLV